MPAEAKKFRFQTEEQYQQAMIEMIKSRIVYSDDEEYEELAEEFIAFCDAKEN